MNPFVISLEGLDASGKTTLAGKLQELFSKDGYSVKVIHDDSHPEKDWTLGEAVDLFYAATTLLAERAIIDAGAEVVLVDRYVDTLLAYAYSESMVYPCLEAIAHGVIQPNLTFFLNCEWLELKKRMESRKEVYDRQVLEKTLDAFFRVLPRHRLFFLTGDSAGYAYTVAVAAMKSQGFPVKQKA